MAMTAKQVLQSNLKEYEYCKKYTTNAIDQDYLLLEIAAREHESCEELEKIINHLERLKRDLQFYESLIEEYIFLIDILSE